MRIATARTPTYIWTCNLVISRGRWLVLQWHLLCVFAGHRALESDDLRSAPQSFGLDSEAAATANNLKKWTSPRRMCCAAQYGLQTLLDFSVLATPGDLQNSGTQ